MESTKLFQAKSVVADIVLGRLWKVTHSSKDKSTHCNERKDIAHCAGSKKTVHMSGCSTTSMPIDCRKFIHHELVMCVILFGNQWCRLLIFVFMTLLITMRHSLFVSGLLDHRMGWGIGIGIGIRALCSKVRQIIVCTLDSNRYTITKRGAAKADSSQE
jgi:hypothetical protein